ncbi:putative outer membrane protein pmp20 [Phytophthora citrophthora]|uniref:Outer membrane protein pmp20 n=1 Tax=Phytophthora citrophthora TaxID=4793 RepID=A0AAD9LSR0_9STRA|nr:putative outer membrane protein pmp20 [Phytophthora citrophthora]
MYEVDGSLEDTVIPPPGNGVSCSGHGRSQIDGSCKCSVGFTGEGCNNRVVCCSDAHQCHHAVCEMDPAKVIVVSVEFGDDLQGTGAMMNAGDKGTASKAVKTLSRAVALSQEGSVILVYPGMYFGLNNRNLEVLSTNLTFSTLKGPFWTSVDCEKGSRFLFATGSSTKVEGFTLQNCMEMDGGVFKILGKDFSGVNLNVVNSTASQNGGFLYATGSIVTLNQVAVVNSIAGTEAGAIYLEDSPAFMVDSNATKSTAIRGGAMVLRGTSSLTMRNSKLFGNIASESGGGAYVKGTITLNGVILDDNRSPSGGGLSMENGVLVIENCVISNNKAELAGGGITLSDGSILTVVATSIQRNKVQASGGGVYATGTVSIIFDKQDISPSTITGNTALNGAGIYISAAHAIFQGINVENGHADESGGGVVMVDSTVEWLSMTILDNEAVEGGALVLKNSQLTCKGAVLLTKNKAGDGGAIWMSTSTMTGVEGTYCLSNTATANGGALFVAEVSTVENVKLELNRAVKGACMYVKNAKLSLVNSQSLGCVASVAGGGLWVTDSEVTVRGVSLVDSTAPEGGGIFAIASSVSGDMTIENCVANIRGGGMYLVGKSTVLGLNVDKCNAQEGGAVYAVNSDLTIKTSKLLNSYASQRGGGLYATDSTLILTGTVISNGTSKVKGGGAYVQSSTVTHDRVSVEQCSSTTGGGMYLKSSKIQAKGPSSSSQIATNNASDTGGNLFLSGLSSVEQLVISSGIADSGGGMAIDSISATVQGCSIVNNSATFGGGVSLQSNSMCTMKNSVVSQNIAEKRGGGMEILDATLWHDTISMVANRAASGGGVFIRGESRLSRQIDTLSQALLQRNSATTGNGGGIYITKQSRVKADGLALVNSSADQGAGIFVNSSKFELKDSSFQNGNASKGGGIFAIDYSDVKLTNCSFVKNNASQTGGGIGLDGGQQGTVTIFMDNCTLGGNYASEGGGIMLSQTNITGSNTFVMDNYAISGGGIAVTKASVTLSNWDFTNNTVLKNELDARGGALYVVVGVITITDSTLVSNEKATLAPNGGLIYVQDSDTRLSIINSVLRFGQAYSGGLIYSLNAHVRLMNSTLHRGFAYDFGAGILAVNTILDISDSFFYDNFAFYDGGGIYMKESGKLTVSNSFFDLNSVQDRGGAIFLSPGAAITSTISRSNFTRNTNIGYGSTIFVGRKNTVKLSDCIVSRNGGPSTEGGALNAIDATVGIKTSLFELNTAIKGAAIHISRSSNATIENSTIQNNTAIIQGGALHASIRSTAIFTNSTVNGNEAMEGGAVYALGSAVITLNDTSCLYNTASSFGGAIAMKGSAVITIDASMFAKNKAHTGGGISIQNNASVSVIKSQFQDNNASDFGAGIYIDTDTERNTALVHCEGLKFGGNTAKAGKDVHWVYYPWFLFDCIDCTTLSGDDKPFIATSATDITAGWWPANVTSGVSLGVELPTNSSKTTISSADTAASRNTSLTMPKSSVLWPTVVVRDYYGAIATYDNVTRCRATPMGTVEGRFSFVPPSWISVGSGYIVFEGAKVSSKFSDEPYPLYINCTLSPVLQKSITINVLVNQCNPGYENVNGLDGERCYLCPAGATCEQKDLRETTIGVVSPLRQQGYFVSKARSTYAASNCDDPALWPKDDPCKAIQEDDLTSRIHECANASLEVFYKYWSRSRIYACLSGNEYYACDTNTACKEASVPSPSSAAVFISTAATQSSSQCAAGYSGIVCATCSDGYYKASNGSCTQCTDPNDPAVARTTRVLALVPIAVAIAALLFLFYLFSSAGEQHIINHAQAASRFQIYTGGSQVRLALQAAKADVQRRVRSMMQNVAKLKRARFDKKEPERYFFDIQPREAEIPAWRPEKFKIMLGFFQVVGSFKEVYEIPWPHTMSHLMDICSLADFNFVSTTAAECLFKRDYFANYRLSLFALCGMLVLVFLVTLWGTLRYRVKLSTLPRHCVNCGLPVFTLEHRPPPTLARRRATIVADIKQKRKQNRGMTAESKTEVPKHRPFPIQPKRATPVADLKRKLKPKGSVITKRLGKWKLLAQLKKLWAARRRMMENAESSRIVRLVVSVLNWVDRVTQLPASISTHKPRCPTSQRIRNDVLNMVVHSNLRLWRARVWMRLYYKAYQNRCIKLFFWILLLFYPMLCQRVIGMFYCDEIGDHYYMTLDRSNLCYEGTWLFYLPLGITLVVFWVIGKATANIQKRYRTNLSCFTGVPLLFWVIIFMKRSRDVSDTLLLIRDSSQKALKERLIVKMRLHVADHGALLDDKELEAHKPELLTHFLYDRNLNEPSTVAQVGFIYHSYDTHFWWYEVWDLGRKLLLNCIITLLAKAGANRIICGLVVLLVYLCVMLFCKPYKDPSDSALAGVVQIQLFITLFCGLILKMGLLYLDERVIILVTNAAIVTTVMTLVYAVFSILNEKPAGLKRAERQSREEQHRAVAVHVRKLWRMAYGYALTEVYLDNPDAGPMPLLVMTELARRARQDRCQQILDAQLELTSAMNLLPSADDNQTTMVSASQINVIEEEADEY